MTISLPSVSDIATLLAALEQHPIGALWLLLLVLAGILGLWVYLQGTLQSKRPTRAPKV
jgi:hypothetical protein